MIIIIKEQWTMMEYKYEKFILKTKLSLIFT